MQPTRDMIVTSAPLIGPETIGLLERDAIWRTAGVVIIVRIVVLFSKKRLNLLVIHARLGEMRDPRKPMFARIAWSMFPEQLSGG